MRVVASPSTPWTLSIRVPEWAQGSTLAVNDEAAVDVTPGYAEVRREFRAGDVVRLSLPMLPRITRPDPRIDAVRGCIVVERGPEVFALESVDLSARLAAGGFENVRLADGSTPRDSDGGVAVDLVHRGEPDVTEQVALVRYHDWAGRGPSTMRVWIPTS